MLTFRVVFVVAVALCQACEYASVNEFAAGQLSASDCTSVTLTAPAGGFFAVAGSPVTLSATASCPAGSVPEFQFWGKISGAPSWTIITPYVPGSTTYTPTAANVGNWCFSVAARNVGSTDAYQVHGGSACGTVSGPATAPPTSTITIPPTSFASSTWSFIVGPNAMASNSAGILVGGLPSRSGDTVLGFTIPVIGSAGRHITIAAKVADGNMAETVIGSVVSETSSQWTPVTLDVTDTIIPSNGAVTMIVTADSAGVALGNIAMHFTPGSVN